jgi:hypothetical protein
MTTFRTIPLTRGAFAIVDQADYEMLRHWNWCLSSDGYAVRGFNRFPLCRMHRMLMLPDPGVQVDHVNRNKLDNRRCNLRLATPSQQNCNQACPQRGTSRHKGVHFYERDRVWIAAIQVRRMRYTVGRFTDESSAARAYDRAARQHHGVFAVLNFPEEVSA